jgi:hypothetical protein
MWNAAEGGQFQTPDTPRITAISDISRPIPENNAIETSGWLSDFSDEAVDAGICVETRTAFGMSGSPIHKRSKIPGPPGCLATRSQGSRNLRRIGKYLPEVRDPISTTSMRFFGEAC